MNDSFKDIIHLPHPEPKTHRRMPIEARAAQFAPFAAISGHEDTIANEVIKSKKMYTRDAPSEEDRLIEEDTMEKEEEWHDE